MGRKPKKKSEEMTELEPVSYTHLDVYKRQRLGYAEIFEPRKGL